MRLWKLQSCSVMVMFGRDISELFMLEQRLGIFNLSTYVRNEGRGGLTFLPGILPHLGQIMQ